MKKKIKDYFSLTLSYFRKFLEFVFSDAFRTTIKKMYFNGIDLLNIIIKYIKKQNQERMVALFAVLFLFLLIAFGLTLQ